MKEALAGVPKKEFPVPKNLEPDKQEEEVKNTAPTNLAATYNPDTATVALSWTPAGEGDVIYHIFRKATGETEFTHYLDSKSPSVEDLSVVEGNSYQYYVTLYDPATNIEGTPSNTVSVDIDIPEPPVTDPEQGSDNTTDNGTGTDQGSTDPNQGAGTGNNPGGQNNGVTPPNQGNGNGNGNNGNGNGNGGQSGSNGGGTDGTVTPDQEPSTPTDSGRSDDATSSDPPTGGTDDSSNTGD
ncbi:hypothetical protein D3C77_440560 [compost metagenome]